MGFCLFNNVAIAAASLRAEEGIERILILDWDVHHGNGTQRCFEDDRDLLYFSTHQYPFYPGTGAIDEAGSGRGQGATVNVPLPAGCNDAHYVAVLQRILVPVTLAFRPEMILVSAGFGAHHDDPLAAMRVTREGFAAKVPYIVAAICQLVIAFMLAGVIGHLGRFDIPGALLTAFFLWLGFVAATMAVNHRFQNFGWDLTLIDAGHWLGVLLIQAAIIGAFGV